jgi:hypothetical protein
MTKDGVIVIIWKKLVEACLRFVRGSEDNHVKPQCIGWRSSTDRFITAFGCRRSLVTPEQNGRIASSAFTDMLRMAGHNSVCVRCFTVARKTFPRFALFVCK